MSQAFETIEDRLALHYADGSMNVLGENATEQFATAQRKSDDRGEDDPDLLTNVVRVRVEIIRYVERWRGVHLEVVQTACCPHCGATPVSDTGGPSK